MAQTQRECIDKITDELAALRTEIGELSGLRDDVGELAAKVDKMYKVMDGNGHPGLREQAQMNTAHRERMEEIIDGLWLKVLLDMVIDTAAEAGLELPELPEFAPPAV